MMKRNKLIYVWLIVLTSFFILSWTYTYDTDTPLGSDAPSVIDNRIRETKDAVQERQNIDHYWPLTGSEVSTADGGKHRYITFQGPNTVSSVDADEGILFTKTVSTISELHFTDESENEVQITSGGALLLATDSAGSAQVADDAVDTAAIQDANVTAAKLAANAVTTTKIADDAVTIAKIEDLNSVSTLSIFGTWTNLDSGAAALVKDEVYQVTSDGIVYVLRTHSVTDSEEWGYTDSVNPPTTPRVARRTNELGYKQGGLQMHVRKDDYWKITFSGVTPTIYWLPVGAGECQKQ